MGRSGSAEAVTGDIEFRDVNFRYAADEPLVLTGVDLAIPAGQAIAIVGASGCGKTTTVNLLLGILKPTQGELLIGGKSLDAFGLDNWNSLLFNNHLADAGMC